MYQLLYRYFFSLSSFRIIYSRLIISTEFYFAFQSGLFLKSKKKIMWNPIENGFTVCILHNRTEQIKFLLNAIVDCGVWRSVDNSLFLLYFHPEFGIEMDFSIRNIHNSHAI